jgi:hypothetical protein
MAAKTEFRGATGFFTEHVVDIAESLFKHAWKPFFAGYFIS